MDDELPTLEQTDQVEGPRTSKALVIALLVVAVVLGLVLGRLAIPSRSASTGSLTAAGNDAMVDYQAAVRTGRPVYVLFHSLSWQSCRDISAVVETVMPEYDGKVEFVNALSDSPSGQRLASVFPFQYIPTSFFVGSGGRVTASYTGPLTEAELRQRLDELARGSASQ